MINECELAPEENQLLLNTQAAHYYNFILTNLGQGGGTRQRSPTAADVNGSASASALLDKGSLSVEEVQAVNSTNGIVLQ